jgi:hypothetical protein
MYHSIAGFDVDKIKEDAGFKWKIFLGRFRLSIKKICLEFDVSFQIH